MTASRTARRRLAWSLPVVTAAVVTAGALLPSTASASAHPSLPSRTAQQLLAAVQTSAVQHLSGTVVETARLGLPSLPGSGNAAALTWQTLITGTHTARVWLDGPDRQRLALLGQLSESDIVHSGSDLWTYASDTQQVGHRVLDPAKAKDGRKKDPAKDLRTYTPQGAADQVLAAIDPSTVVTVDRTARVAGRPAYTLVLTPRDKGTTVRRVRIAIDAQHSVPLRVQLYAGGAKPAFEIGFSDISFARPSASVFTFTPPHGSTVSPHLWPGPARHGRPAPATGPTQPARPAQPTTLGSGWTSVLVLPAPAAGPGPLAALGPQGELLTRLTRPLRNGDRLIQSALVNALITKDGRVLVGAVTPQLLERVAAGHTG